MYERNGVADVRACSQKRGAASDNLPNFGVVVGWPLPWFSVNVAAKGDKVEWNQWLPKC
jgi:hypothetical protein